MERLSVLDMHTCGEPVRIVTGGYPALVGDDILAKRRDARAHHDHLRRALMLEPRGHAGMYGVIPVAPTQPGAAAAALFTHNEGYSTMCGHATIALGKWLVESGQVTASGGNVSFGLELPCGVVEVTCLIREGQVVETSFVSVSAFLAGRDIALDVPGLGRVTCDLAYGGAYYLILPSSSLGIDLLNAPLAQLIELGTQMTAAGRAQLDIRHEEAPDLAFLYGTILIDDAAPDQPTFNLCVFAEGQIDRSPTGSGVTARLARDHARGLIAPGMTRRFAGPTGGAFSASVVSTEEADGRMTCRVRVAGQSSYTGTAEFQLREDDPLRYGFTLPARFADLPAL
ncbi:proline racemase family protein [Sphingobium lignivorans]|uniref:Trans-L-3-hydroxyproline dehydratase n=1 Tax=Sphingobium lignivorans TaxID=2735886 RepID=A0ABR6NF35_9SPHN|nr:proline racemase family protein [Sphingobium lignivorans]MBB5985876.1 trans-L-3-hydroxyproline dehydratase [Sphingobium lignivorans]